MRLPLQLWRVNTKKQRIIPLTRYEYFVTFEATMGAIKSMKCMKGHLLRGKNLYIRANGTRECKACSLARSKRWRKRKLAAA
jgi:hypothetical protein